MPANFLTCRFRPLDRSRITARAKRSCRSAARPARAAVGTMGGGPTYAERATEGTGMSPGEIRACYRLYAAYRRSHQIYAFPDTILAMTDAGDPGELAVLLCLHTGLKGVAREIGHGAPNDDLRRPVVARHVSRLRKMLASFAAQQFSHDALVGR